MRRARKSPTETQRLGKALRRSSFFAAKERRAGKTQDDGRDLDFGNDVDEAATTTGHQT